jgi:hypothetical protein
MDDKCRFQFHHQAPFVGHLWDDVFCTNRPHRTKPEAFRASVRRPLTTNERQWTRMNGLIRVYSCPFVVHLFGMSICGSFFSAER